MTNVFFSLFTFNSRAGITTKYTFNQVRCFFYIQYRFHGLMGQTSKIHEIINSQSLPIYVSIYIYIQRESIQQEINFFSKSFRQRLSQLHIYINICIYIYIYIYKCTYIYIYVLDISQDLLFQKIWFSLLCQPFQLFLNS